MNETKRIFLFGESEKGEHCFPMHIRSLEEAFDTLGQPLEDSQGVGYAVQTLLHKNELIYYRVREEGFCREDYKKGAELLNKKGQEMNLSAIFLPGVGDREIIESIGFLCSKMKAILILTEKDLFDYLTASKY